MPTELHHLNKDDLFLLMESYRNMIQMHATLLEQQKQIIELQNSIVSKEDDISSNQRETINKTNEILDKLNVYSLNLKDMNKNLLSSSSDIEKSILAKLDNMKDKIGTNQTDVTKQHTNINTRIYVAMAGSATIIIALIGLLVTFSDKLSLLKEIHIMLKAISDYFGLGN